MTLKELGIRLTWQIQFACTEEKGRYMFTSPLYATKRALRVHGKEELLARWKQLQDGAKEYWRLGLAPAQIFKSEEALPDVWFKEDLAKRRTLAMLDLAFEEFYGEPMEFMKISE